jgi:cell division protein FtsZ
MVNQIMTAVADLFGKDCYVTMGAVIDESMPQRVEVCVLGTTDIGGRGLIQRRLLASARAGGAAPAKIPATRTPPAAPGALAGDKPHAANPPPKVEQNEFAFSEVESRGLFDKTDRNLFEGQDLDVPTYLRKGIKITV